MINFIRSNTHNIRCLFLVILSTLLLQACGGQRAFDPNSIGSSSSSAGTAITIKLLTEDTTPEISASVDDAKKLVVYSDKETLKKIWSNYTAVNLDSLNLDFASGQVVLFDSGHICSTEKIKFKSYAAYEKSINSVIVSFDFTDEDKRSSSSGSSKSSSSLSSSSASSSSSCGNAEGTRPFRFYYVETRAKILFDENVPAP